MGWDAEYAEAAYWASDCRFAYRLPKPTELDRPEHEFWAKAARHTSAKRTKETKMREMSTEELESMIEMAQAEISRREKMPVEPVDAYLVTFKFQFAGEGRVYTYAAIRANGVWYATGGVVSRPLQGVSWEVMINHFLDRGKILDLWTAITHYAVRLP